MILHICCNLAGSRVFPELFDALQAAGVSQAVFVPEKRAGNMGKNLPKNVPICQRLTVKQADALFFFRKAQRSVPVIRREMNLKDVRLIHAHTLFTDGSIALRLQKETGIPFGVTLRYSDIEVIWRREPHLRPLARRVLEAARFIAFLSEGVRERVLTDWFSGEARDRMAKKAVVVPNGIDPAWLDGQARTVPHDPVRVGFAGLLNRRKRPLDALAAVHAADATGGKRFIFDACGRGPLEERLKQQLRPGDALREALSGMGAMKAFYRDIDLLLVPSEAETFGMVYLEAMSQGVPVLYTRGQGFDGQFPEGEIGLAVPCGDAKAQAEALQQLAAGDYAALSARCVEGAKRYAWLRVAAKWRAVYENACSMH